VNARLLSPLRVASLAALSVVAMSAATPAYAADGDVRIVNTETVQVYTSSTGHVQTRRVYEQLSLFGNGTVDVKNPISTSHLRNLDGFGGFDVKNGEQVTRTTVQGEKKLRSVSNYGGQLPLTVAVRYKLDGKTVEPGDIVGKSGKLDVEYTVENVTAKSQEVTFDDGKGGTVTKTVDVPIPMVGSLSLVAPSSFTNVASQQANIAGDGKGGTKLSFTMTLFPPLGSTTAVFGYTADIKDGVVPRSDISALPVNPLDSPTFKTAADSYKGGADTGAELTDGASQIDSNLLKLRDGAGDLLAGLIKLRDGADQLNAGLAGEAAPGAAKLAAGASQLDDGLGQLNSGAKRLAAGTGELEAGTGTLDAGTRKLRAGAGKLAAGADELSAGTGRAADGGKQLYAGTQQLSAGATKVAAGAATVDGYMKQIAAGQGDLLSGLQLLESGVKALPTSVQQKLAADQQYLALLGGMQKVVDGIGDPNDVTNPSTGQPATVFGALNAIRYGLRTPGGYAGNDCATKLTGGTPTQCGALDAVQFISGQLSSGATDLDQLKPVLGVLNGTSNAGGPCAGYPAYAPPPTPPTNPCQAVSTLYYALFGTSPAPAGAQAKVNAAADALKDVYQQVDAGVMNLALPRLRAAMVNPGANANCAVGAATADPTDDCGIKQAVGFFKANIPALVDGISASIRDTLLAGISAPAGGCLPTSKTLICGAGALASGGSSLAAGAGDLAIGAGDLSAGASLLSGKTGELSAGLTKIDGGAGQLADGAGQLSDGTQELAAGGSKLAAGARKLNDGAGQLAEGTTQAKDGSGQLSAGAGKLAGGLKDAADGSGQLAGGLKQAAGGAPQLVDGAQKLSDQGTKKLVQAGELTAQNYGEMYATMTAGAKRAEAENMAFGAPTDAIGLTAYSYVIQGDDGEGSRNLVRGLGGLAILGAGGGVLALRRRLV
jgi:putative membrane protein